MALQVHMKMMVGSMEFMFSHDPFSGSLFLETKRCDLISTSVAINLFDC